MPPHENSELFDEASSTFRKADITKQVDLFENKIQPWYIIIDNKVYDIRDFAPSHPGGSVILTHVGKDASDAFHNFHPESTNEILANCYVGDLDPSDITTSKGFTKELREIKSQLLKNNMFASSKTYYFFKILSNLAIWYISVLTLANFGHSYTGCLLAAGFMGLFWQQCGWLAHDFLHHQVFAERKWNDLMGSFIGGVCQAFSPSWWKDKHNTHHASPNVHNKDPDIMTHPILTWSEHALTDLFNPTLMEAFSKSEFHSNISPEIARFLVKHQTLLYFPILAFARISWCLQSIFFVLPDGQKHKPANTQILVSKHEQASLIIHYIWYLTIMYLYIPNWKLALTFYLGGQAICGWLLALVFSLNHNGMPVLTEQESQETEFFVEQVITARDIMAGNPRYQWCVDWFTGGLNYQIEHHLFPSMPRHNFHKIQPIVEGLCKEHNIPYHRTSFWQGTIEVFNLLGKVSAASKKVI